MLVMYIRRYFALLYTYIIMICDIKILMMHITQAATYELSKDYIHIYVTNCDWILENSSKSHIFISVYLSLQHEKYCIPNNIS